MATRHFNYKMKRFTVINGYKIHFRITPDGQCVPMAGDILRATGLELMDPVLDKFYDLLNQVETRALLRWVCYECDLNYETAREKVKHYFIIDSGLRMKYAGKEEIRTEELQVAADHLSATEETHCFSYDEVIEMINAEGFNFKIIQQ